MPSKSTKSPLIRVITIVSASFFLLSTLFLFLRLVFVPSPPPQGNLPSSESQSVDTGLEAQAAGYESVLEREPENVTALQGLIEVRLQLNDLAGAIPPLQKLIEIYPEDQGLKALLATIEQELANQESQP